MMGTAITEKGKTMRLIDADRFKAYMQEEYLCYDHTLADIDAQPTVDPVKHGHWIDIDSESYTWKVRCSECSHERSMMSTQGKYPKYCEECGAKMNVSDTNVGKMEECDEIS